MLTNTTLLKICPKVVSAVFVIIIANQNVLKKSVNVV